jgi:hypothetical protein
MIFKMSYSDFELLAKYLERQAKGKDITLNYQQNQFLEVRVSNLLEEPVVITLYPQEDGKATSFPKISVTRRLGDEIK